MYRPGLWMIGSCLPFLGAILVDQVTKAAILNASLPVEFPGGEFILFRNYGFLFGSMQDLGPRLAFVLPAVLAGFLTYAYAIFQYFLARSYGPMRWGAALLFAGAFSNTWDKISYGYVIDFIRLAGPGIDAVVFNLADCSQWLGAGLLLFGFIGERSALFPVNEGRKRRLVDLAFQVRFCTILLSIGGLFGGILIALSYAYLKATFAELTFVSDTEGSGYLRALMQTYTVVCLFFFLTLFVVGMQWSHRIAGPVLKFSSFLDGVLNGEVNSFKLRGTDEFRHFENLAYKFQDTFHDALRITRPALEPGASSPTFALRSLTGNEFSSTSLLGTPSWIIFYRYATCPLCSMHLESIRRLLEYCRNSGVNVIIFYETDFSKLTDTERQTRLELATTYHIDMVADRDRTFYRRFRTSARFAAAFHPATIYHFFQSIFRGFRQGSIDGLLGQRPAHFILDQNNTVTFSHYGRHLYDHPPADIVKQQLQRCRPQDGLGSSTAAIGE